MAPTRREWITVCVILPGLTFLFSVSGFFVWSPRNCWHYDVDIRTGRVRYTRYLMYIKINERVDETWVSRSTTSDKSQDPDWRRVYTFSPFTRHSPHYQFHSAIHQIKTLDQVGTYVPYEPGARILIADTLLEVWQEGDSDDAADDFIAAISRRGLERFKAGSRTFPFSDVPVPKT